MIAIEVVARVVDRGIMSREHVLLTVEGETVEEIEAELTQGLRELADQWPGVGLDGGD